MDNIVYSFKKNHKQEEIMSNSETIEGLSAEVTRLRGEVQGLIARTLELGKKPFPEYYINQWNDLRKEVGKYRKEQRVVKNHVELLVEQNNSMGMIKEVSDEELKEWWRLSGATQAWVAQKLNISQPAASSWINGKNSNVADRYKLYKLLQESALERSAISDEEADNE